MTESKEIIKHLSQPLDMQRVKRRQSSGEDSVPYLEGFDVIQTANKIFGYQWSFELASEPRVMFWAQALTTWDRQKRERVPVLDKQTGQQRAHRAGIVYLTGKVSVELDGKIYTHGDVGRLAFTGDAPEALDTALSGAATDCLKRCFRQPGVLREISGVEVEEYYALLDPVELIGTRWKGQARIWAERLNILDKDTVVLAAYSESNGWLDGQVAVTRHPYGREVVTYIGAYLDEGCQKVLLQNISEEAGCKPVMQTPIGVEACRRVHPTHGEILILINHTRIKQQVPLPWLAHEHIQQRESLSTISLEPYGVALLTHK
jgi:hypothetical protein